MAATEGFIRSHVPAQYHYVIATALQALNAIVSSYVAELAADMQLPSYTVQADHT